MEIARRLKNACGNRLRRSIARDAGIDRQTLINILNGDTWCDAPTIYRLEKSFKVHLWSIRHVPPSQWVQPPIGRRRLLAFGAPRIVVALKIARDKGLRLARHHSIGCLMPARL